MFTFILQWRFYLQPPKRKCLVSFGATMLPIFVHLCLFLTVCLCVCVTFPGKWSAVLASIATFIAHNFLLWSHTAQHIHQVGGWVGRWRISTPFHVLHLLVSDERRLVDKHQAGAFDVRVWTCPLSSDTIPHHPLPLVYQLHRQGLWVLFALGCVAGITSPCPSAW